jgi:hypothetical protein
VKPVTAKPITAKTRKPAAATKALPTYSELADLVAELTEINIAGLDHDGPGAWSFVSCFTYGPKVMPPHWQRAINAREVLIKHRIIVRQNRRHARS